MVNLVETYKGKRIFLTGHTGFKGAWLSAMLHQLGARVKGYSLPPEHEQGLFMVLGGEGVEESVLADIRDRQRLEQEILAFAPDFIFHLAAQPLVRRSYEIPAETFDVNVTGTANVLEAATRLKKDCVMVMITTDKVYENKEKAELLYKEGDVLGGYDPYSASKACAELVVSSFRNSFFLSAAGRPVKSLASTRAGNVIGGGDWSRDRIIPDIVRSLMAGRTIDVRNPAAVRPWQHVLEPLTGYLVLGAKLQESPKVYSNAFNFGPLPEGHLPVSEVVKTAIDVWGNGDWRDASTPGAPHEAGLLKLDIQKAQEQLSWRPKLDAREAIRWTLEWYKQPLSEQRRFTFEQINHYFSL